MDLGKVIREFEIELDEDLVPVPARPSGEPDPAPESVPVGSAGLASTPR